MQQTQLNHFMELSLFKKWVIFSSLILFILVIFLRFYSLTDKIDIVIDDSQISSSELISSIKINTPALDLKIEKKIDELLSEMSIEQKIAQMILIEFSDESFEISKFNVGALDINSADTVDNKYFQEELLDSIDELKNYLKSQNLPYIPPLVGIQGHHGVALTKKAMIFPQPINLGATRNEKLVEQVALATLEQANVYGAHWLRSIATTQVLDQRSPLVERIFSENLELNKSLSLVHFEALKSKNKLFEANNWLSSSISENMSNQVDQKPELLKRYLLNNQINALNAGADILHLSANDIERLDQNTNQLKINYIKQDLGFDGIVVSSAYAPRFINGCWLVTCDNIINAGVDMVSFNALDINEQVGTIQSYDANYDANRLKEFIDNTVQSVENEKIAISRVNDAVRRILRVKYKLGLFDQDYNFMKNLDKKQIKAHKKLAEKAVVQSALLLKNANNTLPIKSDEKILLTGLASNNFEVLSGIDSSDTQYKKSTIKKALSKNKNVTWIKSDFFDSNFVINSLYEHYLEEKEKKAKRVNRVLRASPIKMQLEDFSPRSIQNSIKEFNEKTKEYFQSFDKIIIAVNVPVYRKTVLTNYELNHLNLSLFDQSVSLLDLTKEIDVPVIVLMLNSNAVYAPTVFNHADSVVSLFRPGTELDGLNQLLFTDKENRIQKDFTAKSPISWPKNPCDFYSIELFETYDPFIEVGYGLNYQNDITDYQNWPKQIEALNGCQNNARRSL